MPGVTWARRQGMFRPGQGFSYLARVIECIGIINNPIIVIGHRVDDVQRVGHGHGSPHFTPVNHLGPRLQKVISLRQAKVSIRPVRTNF